MSVRSGSIPQRRVSVTEKTTAASRRSIFAEYRLKQEDDINPEYYKHKQYENIERVLQKQLLRLENYDHVHHNLLADTQASYNARVEKKDISSYDGYNRWQPPSSVPHQLDSRSSISSTNTSEYYNRVKDNKPTNNKSNHIFPKSHGLKLENEELKTQNTAYKEQVTQQEQIVADLRTKVLEYESQYQLQQMKTQEANLKIAELQQKNVDIQEEVNEVKTNMYKITQESTEKEELLRTLQSQLDDVIKSNKLLTQLLQQKSIETSHEQ